MAEGQPRFAAFDIDQTMYRWSLFLDQIDMMIEMKLMDPSIREDAQEARRRWEDREGTYDAYVEAQVLRFRQWGMAGVSVEDLVRVSRKLLQRKNGRQYIFTRELLKTLRVLNYKTAAISGSTVQVVKIFAEHWGFDRWIGTEFEIGTDGRFTGDDAKTVRHYLVKNVLFENLRRELCCSENDSIAVGDALSDLPMLVAAQYPIAFNPDAPLEEMARKQRIPVVKERKSVITILRASGPNHPSPIGSDGFVEETVFGILPLDVATCLRDRLRDIGVHLR